MLLPITVFELLFFKNRGLWWKLYIVSLRVLLPLLTGTVPLRSFDWEKSLLFNVRSPLQCMFSLHGSHATSSRCHCLLSTSVMWHWLWHTDVRFTGTNHVASIVRLLLFADSGILPTFSNLILGSIRKNLAPEDWPVGHGVHWILLADRPFAATWSAFIPASYPNSACLIQLNPNHLISQLYIKY